MLFDSHDDDALYEALLNRSTNFEGRAYVGVSSTGIFCRLSCPARKPKRENCTFFTSVKDCLEAGFRPCKRCHPLSPAGADPAISRLLEALERDPARRFREDDLVRMKLDPSTVRRQFKLLFGMTFLQMARQRRLQAGFNTLADGGKVIDAQLEAGFSSPSAFREAFAKLLGTSPAKLLPNAPFSVSSVESPLGPMVAVSDEASLYLLEFFDRKALPAELHTLQRDTKGQLGFGETTVVERLRSELRQFFSGQSATFSVPIAPAGSPFSLSVWSLLQEIPAGTTRSYRDLAIALGRPTATRAVARANGANRIALLIPCHRVIGADGSLTGYGGGLWRKQKLLEIEHAYRNKEEAT